ncbi:MAG: imidazole glycerol phosphate synthase subunit HisH, partial [Clostridia bacterium]|nr:imidazole glycerol phosphate synthase subunit HisH [Clostridia bacterium]
MIAIVDYGVGNLFSLASSLKQIGASTVVSGESEMIRACDKIILPGVGAFGDAAAKLRAQGLDKLLIEEAGAGKDILGICLGMQLLFEKSYEYGAHKGLGLLRGEVVPMEGRLPPSLKIPHIGWNALHFTKTSKLQTY